jgi:ketosteroid isomerase-like protein
MAKIIAPVFCIILCCANLNVQGQTKDSLEVISAANTFIKAFISFDWETFRNSFSKDATIFFPSWKEGKRRNGKKEVEETWLQMFPGFIDSTKKVTINILPKDFVVQLYGKTAIVSFHLGDGEKYLSRRTIVFIKENENWKIVHLHASNLVQEKSN